MFLEVLPLDLNPILFALFTNEMYKQITSMFLFVMLVFGPFETLLFKNSFLLFLFSCIL